MPKPDKDITRKENYRTTMQEHRSESLKIANPIQQYFRKDNISRLSGVYSRNEKLV